jgi:nucleoside-diphosphate-sugar epimerase
VDSDPEGIAGVRRARIAVTGVGGFIGRRVAELGREAGADVWGIDVDDRAVRGARAAGVDARRGDVTSDADVAALVRGADVVVHTAAVVEEDGDRARFERVNVDGTRRVAEAARAAGARALVHLSSVMVYGFRYPPMVDEDGPLRGEGNPYCETKIASERAALALDARGGLRVVALRAGDVYGPGSRPWVLRPLALMRKRLFVLPEGGRGVMNPVYVDDLARACLCAAARALGDEGVGGLALNVTDGAPVTFAEFYRPLARALGRDGVPSLPTPALRAAFRLLEAGCAAARVRPPATAAALDFVARPHGVSSARARALLRWVPEVDRVEGWRRTLAWARREGLLGAASA